MSEVSTQTRFRIEGMDCASCASKIDTAVRRIDGVSDVTVSVTAGTMMLQHNAKSDLKALKKKVTGLGYSIAPLASKSSSIPPSQNENNSGHDHSGHDHDNKDDHAKEEVLGLHGHDQGPSNGPWWQSRKGQLAMARHSC